MTVNATDVTTFKAWSGHPATADADARISELITSVSRAFEGYIGAHDIFEAVERTEDYDVVRDYQKTFALNIFPVTAVASVHYDTGWDFGAGAEVTEGTDFVVDLDRGRLQFPTSSMRKWPKALRVKYTGGFAANTAAFLADARWDTLVHAANVQVQFELQRKDSPGSNREFSRQGGATFTSEVKLLDHVETVLRRFARFRYA